MKIQYIIPVALLFIACKVTKKSQTTVTENPPEEKQEQVFIPADALDAQVPANTDPAPPPPPPPPAPPSNTDELYKVVEEMPRFPGCESMEGTKDDIHQCAKDKMLEYIYHNLKYPASAKEDGTEGMMVMQFVVEKDGSINEVRAVRSICDACAEETTRLLKSMNDMPERWIPGKQRGRAVRVLYTLPVRFKLDYEYGEGKK